MDRLSDYDYHLPEELIAQTPLEDRAASRLLRLDRASGGVSHRQFSEVPDLLEPGDLLVMNDTRVSARRLLGRKASGGAIEALVLREVGGGVFEALMRPARSLREGSRVAFDDGFEADVVRTLSDGLRHFKVHLPPDQARAAVFKAGSVPLPPYIHTALSDAERYQTVYSRREGSAAAPTAGLHFTHDVLNRLEARGVRRATVTLHVSIDTFRPIMTENVEEHTMHGEECAVPPDTAIAIANCKGRVIAVGTTTVRTLETFATGPRRVETGSRVSTLYIRPGHEFQALDGMFTNFHLPKTTLMLLVSALAGRDAVMSAYAEAVRERYRFLSFGDSMLIL